MLGLCTFDTFDCPCCGMVIAQCEAGMFDRSQCTACERIVGVASTYVNKFVQKETKWSKSLARDIMDHMSKHSCSDEEQFAKNSGALLDGCIDFMAGYYEKTRAGFRKRLHPRYEEYGEDIVPVAFCREIGACGEDDNLALDRTLQKSKREEEHRKRMKEL